MDFKVAGTKKGITAIQMDLKNDGLTMAIIKNALDITYDARVQILDQIMLPCISEPRKEVSEYAPKMTTIHIDPDKIREVIGSGGKVIQFGAFVEIAPGKDGLVHISKLDKKRVEKVEDVVTVGDMIWVKFMEIDEKGRWNLSRKDALLEIEAQQAAAAKEQ